MERKRKTMRSYQKWIAAAGLCLLLCACRESPVLTETLYQQAAPEVEEDTEMLEPEDEGLEDEDFSEEESEEAETPRDTEEDMGLTEPEPIPEETPEPAESAAEVLYNPNSGNDWQSQQAPEQTAQGTEGAAEPEPAPEAAEPVPEAEPPEDTAEPEGGEPESIPGEGELTGKRLVDAAGRTVEVPENVKAVTATGAAAQLVELLGGSGRLLGADSAFRAAPLAQAAFSDLAQVNEWWSGDGGISEERFAALTSALSGAGKTPSPPDRSSAWRRRASAMWCCRR